MLDLTQGRHTERELLLAKIVISDHPNDAEALLEKHQANIIEKHDDYWLISYSGTPEQVEQFIIILAAVEILELTRTGTCALAEKSLQI